MLRWTTCARALLGNVIGHDELKTVLGTSNRCEPQANTFRFQTFSTWVLIWPSSLVFNFLTWNHLYPHHPTLLLSYFSISVTLSAFFPSPLIPLSSLPERVLLILRLSFLPSLWNSLRSYNHSFSLFLLNLIKLPCDSRITVRDCHLTFHMNTSSHLKCGAKTVPPSQGCRED